MRIFGLLYGIVRMNRKPRRLAKAISRYCDWNDESQQNQIQRMIYQLNEFPDGFCIIGVRIEVRHFIGLLIAAMTASLGSLAKSKIATLGM